MAPSKTQPHNPKRTPVNAMEQENPAESQSNHPPRPPRRKKGMWLRMLLLASGVVVVSMVVIWAALSFFQPTTVGPDGEVTGGKSGWLPSLPSMGNDRILLVMGVDANYDKTDDPFKGTRTDTMMMVRLHSDSKQASIVSIPRDSKVYLANRGGVNKINAAHALGGAEYAVKTVEQSFGIPVDQYMVINFKGVREVVDVLGGVDIYVEKPLKYRDRTAKLNIAFDPGVHHLNGEEAEAFLRFRHDEMGDIGRIRRQQQFLSAFAKKMKDPWILTKVPELLNLADKHIRTNMSKEELLKLAAFAKDIKFDNLRTAILPGRPSRYSDISYWIIDANQAANLLDRVILNTGPTEDEKPVSKENPLSVGILYHPQLDAKRVEDFAKHLEKQGFRIRCQAKRRDAKTQIVEHTYRIQPNHTQELRGTHRILGDARLIFSPVSTTFESNACSNVEDYTVFLGQDSQSML